MRVFMVGFVLIRSIIFCGVVRFVMRFLIE